MLRAPARARCRWSCAVAPRAGACGAVRVGVKVEVEGLESNISSDGFAWRAASCSKERAGSTWRALESGDGPRRRLLRGRRRCDVARSFGGLRGRLLLVACAGEGRGWLPRKKGNGAKGAECGPGSEEEGGAGRNGRGREPRALAVRVEQRRERREDRPRVTYRRVRLHRLLRLRRSDAPRQ